MTSIDLATEAVRRQLKSALIAARKARMSVAEATDLICDRLWDVSSQMKKSFVTTVLEISPNLGSVTIEVIFNDYTETTISV